MAVFFPPARRTPPHTNANQTCAEPGKLPNDGHGVYIGPNGGPGTYIENNTGGCRWSFGARVRHFLAKVLPFRLV